ncbi:hypothetical protein [Candidatus Vidania fulgoroideorum]
MNNIFLHFSGFSNFTNVLNFKNLFKLFFNNYFKNIIFYKVFIYSYNSRFLFILKDILIKKKKRDIIFSDYFSFKKIDVFKKKINKCKFFLDKFKKKIIYKKNSIFNINNEVFFFILLFKKIIKKNNNFLNDRNIKIKKIKKFFYLNNYIKKKFFINNLNFKKTFLHINKKVFFLSKLKIIKKNYKIIKKIFYLENINIFFFIISIKKKFNINLFLIYNKLNNFIFLKKKSYNYYFLFNCEYNKFLNKKKIIKNILKNYEFICSKFYTFIFFQKNFFLNKKIFFKKKSYYEFYKIFIIFRKILNHNKIKLSINIFNKLCFVYYLNFFSNIFFKNKIEKKYLFKLIKLPYNKKSIFYIFYKISFLFNKISNLIYLKKKKSNLILNKINIKFNKILIKIYKSNFFLNTIFFNKFLCFLNIKI